MTQSATVIDFDQLWEDAANSRDQPIDLTGGEQPSLEPALRYIEELCDWLKAEGDLSGEDAKDFKTSLSVIEKLLAEIPQERLNAALEAVQADN